MPRAAAMEAAQRRLLRWFDAHARTFPWRDHRDPYRTLVAEVMLQQTQAGRVADVYPEFLDHFPTAEYLAHAPAMDVIRAWRGLGYNRRAVDLQRASHDIAHAGEFPSDVRSLRRLPGVAEYTAAAVACFAFDAQIPVVDINTRRVLARAALGAESESVAVGVMNRTAKTWLLDGEAYRWNQALMDLGALVCRPARPRCGKCPLHESCRYYARGLHRRPRASRAAVEPLDGSRRRKRGAVVDALRAAAERGLSLARLAAAVHSDGSGDRDLMWLVELLEGLERDGLVTLTPAARRGSSRGLVRLPS
ncbi:MAG: A/G-specific adenine glycosylase [Actinomycetota bacterium]